MRFMYHCAAAALLRSSRQRSGDEEHDLRRAGAAGTLDTSRLLYPVYYCLANGALAVLIRYRAHHLRRAASVSDRPG
jgi:hypothetical protein